MTGNRKSLSPEKRNNMSDLHVSLGERSYDIINRRGSLAQCGPLAAKVLRGRKVFVVSDSGVAPLYGDTVLDSLRGAGFEPSLLTVPAGESSKCPARLAGLWEALAAGGVTRSDCVAALGGGMVGDLAGFAASTILRGVDFLQLPTTLLAQVDSSVGGKVAVDLEAGKNLAGSFYQPKLVIMDPDVLSSLPDRTFHDGMAEVIKYGCIWDEALFERLAALKNRAGVEAAITEITTACCDIKRQVVEQDELDTGLRMLLNFGHTFGHVYEKAYHYQTYTHGEAVAAGMVGAARLGEKMGYTESGTAARIEAVLQAYHLPTEIEAPRTAYAETMSLDKKSLGGEIRFVFLERIGKARPVRLSKEELFAKL